MDFVATPMSGHSTAKRVASKHHTHTPYTSTYASSASTASTTSSRNKRTTTTTPSSIPPSTSSRIGGFVSSIVQTTLALTPSFFGGATPASNDDPIAATYQPTFPIDLVSDDTDFRLEQFLISSSSRALSRSSSRTDMTSVPSSCNESTLLARIQPDIDSIDLALRTWSTDVELCLETLPLATQTELSNIVRPKSPVVPIKCDQACQTELRQGSLSFNAFLFV
jgi:hypothetical protein